VEINLESIKDPSYVAEKRRTITVLLGRLNTPPGA